MDPTTNPFVAFTAIVAPAVLTNAASVMSLTTSNRLARAMDRSRVILSELAKADGVTGDERARRARQIELLRHRAMVLTRALGWYQFAIGSFAAATLIALVGTALNYLEPRQLAHAALIGSLVCAGLGVTAIAVAASRVVRETWLSYELLREDTAEVMESLRSPVLTSGLDADEPKH
jgi:hypothetical protein